MTKKRSPRELKGALRSRNREANLVLGIGFAGIVIVLFILLGRPVSQESSQTVTGERLIRTDSPSRGPADAPVTIVEFLDPECESCRAMFPVIEEILERYEGQIRLVVRYFPLHNNSELAAMATEAAGAQGQYWQMQALLFERQPEWGEQQASQRERFIQYASELGLNMDAFVLALDEPTYRQRVERDRADGEALGVTGTPTLFINGQRLERLNAQLLIERIEAALQ